MPDEIRLQVDGRRYGGWKTVTVTRSLETVAHTFEVSLTEKWPGSETRRPIRAGAPCRVLLNDRAIITGYIDDVEPSYDGSSHGVTISGRSKACDLVDCSLVGEGGKGLEWSGQTLLQIARDLAGRFGISVTAATDVGGAFRKERLEPEQTIWEFLERLARIRAVRFVSDAEGNLVIIRAGGARVGPALILGKTVREAAGKASMRDRFSRYTVLAQGNGSDTFSGDAAAHARGEATDDRVARFRPTSMIADGPADTADCQRRAQWQRNVAWGRSRQATYTVTGWQNDTGPWSPNALVPVRDEWLGINADRLISSVTFKQDEQGQRTKLAVMPAEAFDLVPLPEDDGGESEDTMIWTQGADS